jgi:hypothetical protein
MSVTPVNSLTHIEQKNKEAAVMTMALMITTFVVALLFAHSQVPAAHIGFGVSVAVLGFAAVAMTVRLFSLLHGLALKKMGM